MLDWGVGLMNYYTDMKRMAYVLKEGEKEIPKSIQHAFDKAVDVRQIVIRTIKPGITAKQNEVNVYKALQDAGYTQIEFNKPSATDKTDVITVCHSVGDWGHGTGPSVAFFQPVQTMRDRQSKFMGAFDGGKLAAKRMCRCHPWGGDGFDPVPPKH